MRFPISYVLSVCFLVTIFCTASFGTNVKVGNVSITFKVGSEPEKCFPQLHYCQSSAGSYYTVRLPGSTHVYKVGEGILEDWTFSESGTEKIVINKEGMKYVYEDLIAHNTYRIKAIRNNDNTDRSLYEYDSNNGLLLKHKSANNPNNIYVEYSYDVNQKVDYVTAYGPGVSRTYDFIYDSTGIYLKGVTNTSGGGSCTSCSGSNLENMLFEYYPTGKIRYQKDLSGNVVYEYIYDSNGKVIAKKNGNGDFLTKYSYSQVDGQELVEVKEYLSTDYFRVFQEYLDNAKRVVKKIEYKNVFNTTSGFDPNTTKYEEIHNYEVYDSQMIETSTNSVRHPICFAF
jgi:hypothetical protein